MSLAKLKMMLRQPGINRPETTQITTADIELIDWMDEQHIEPGQDIPDEA